MQRRKDYERASAKAATLAKIVDEGEKKLTPNSLDDIPAENNKEDRVQ